jgi:hypothetical protein
LIDPEAPDLEAEAVMEAIDIPDEADMPDMEADPEAEVIMADEAEADLVAPPATAREAILRREKGIKRLMASSDGG